MNKEAVGGAGPAPEAGERCRSGCRWSGEVGARGVCSRSQVAQAPPVAGNSGVWAGKVRNYGFLLEHTDFKGKTWAV